MLFLVAPFLEVCVCMYDHTYYTIMRVRFAFLPAARTLHPTVVAVVIEPIEGFFCEGNP
jgi:hypothetical protein